MLKKGLLSMVVYVILATLSVGLTYEGMRRAIVIYFNLLQQSYDQVIP